MRKQLLLGIPALACATSCVPHDASRIAAVPKTAVRPVNDTATLLGKLSLRIPADLKGTTLSSLPPETAPDAAPPFLANVQTTDDAARASECLTAAIYYEARSESVDGQRAVAQVVLNRVRDRAFPASVCGVVYQGSHRSTGCQFSFTCDGSMLRPREPGAWERARIVAEAALAGSVYAPVGAATSYHANYVSPWWAPSLTRIAAIGSHIFYRWRGAMEEALTFRQSYAGAEPLVSAGSPITAVQDVAVHVGDDPDSLVTVHRGTAASIAAPAVASVAPRLMTVSGVRVHRGLDPNAGDDAPIVADDPA